MMGMKKNTERLSTEQQRNDQIVKDRLRKEHKSGIFDYISEIPGARGVVFLDFYKVT